MLKRFGLKKKESEDAACAQGQGTGLEPGSKAFSKTEASSLDFVGHKDFCFQSLTLPLQHKADSDR